MHARSIQNLLAGRKTQTRRIVKWLWGAPHAQAWSVKNGRFEYADNDGWHDCAPPRCLYGSSGDLLWVRESVLFNSEPGRGESPWIYRADVDHPEAVRISEDCNANWRPSIHMPRRASRLTLRLTDVRVERVQETSVDDILCEGIILTADDEGHRAAWAKLWDHTNGPGAWERNDWCWCLSFEVLRQNVDVVLRRLAK